MVTTAGRARAAAWTMAESSETVTPDRMSTDCGLVRCCSLRIASETPVATVAASRITPMAAARLRGKRMKKLSVGFDAQTRRAPGSGLGDGLLRVPGHHELPVRLETRRQVE